ncbi:hypothetical protein ACOME3_003949 [Neoechinorhynchus agilis]
MDPNELSDIDRHKHERAVASHIPNHTTTKDELLQLGLEISSLLFSNNYDLKYAAIQFLHSFGTPILFIQLVLDLKDGEVYTIAGHLLAFLKSQSTLRSREVRSVRIPTGKILPSRLLEYTEYYELICVLRDLLRGDDLQAKGRKIDKQSCKCLLKNVVGFITLSQSGRYFISKVFSAGMKLTKQASFDLFRELFEDLCDMGIQHDYTAVAVLTGDDKHHTRLIDSEILMEMSNCWMHSSKMCRKILPSILNSSGSALGLVKNSFGNAKFAEIIYESFSKRVVTLSNESIENTDLLLDALFVATRHADSGVKYASDMVELLRNIVDERRENQRMEVDY